MRDRKDVIVSMIAIWLTSLACAFGAAGDWPQFRGPNRDDISTDTGLLKEWPSGGPPLAWKATGIGAGYSGVSISGQRVFTMGDQAGASYVHALNLADGKLLWSTKVGKAGAPGWGGFAGPRCTPTVDGNLVFAADQWGELVCVNAVTGKELWRKNYEKDFGSKRPEWGYAESPLVDDDKVVVTPGGPQGALVALNKTSGATVWRSKEFTDAAQYASLIVAEMGGVRQYISLTDASVAGIAAREGRLLWKARRKGSTAVIPTPIYSDHQVYVTSGYNIGCNLFKILIDGDSFIAEQVYDNKVMVNHHGGVVKVGDYLYGYSEGKGWTCQNFKNGEAVWVEKAKLRKGSLTFADGNFYCREEDGKGTVVLVEATSSGYKERSRFNPPDRSSKNSWPHPVVAGGKLYLRDQDVLLCFDVKAK